ncbi:hypothetical protein PMIN01_12226 [Paraphaeosphaeria minitans]|uniref:Uncharacterized protein n=1 Tax=Paraphaeosphaeria minitans TaxID=565426 RepID=A0A9P6G7S2_9PLEO|nr:hypothetical protein PMIN01_12226 [Paraphaeosphaeria minitans]
MKALNSQNPRTRNANSFGRRLAANAHLLLVIENSGDGSSAAPRLSSCGPAVAAIAHVGLESACRFRTYFKKCPYQNLMELDMAPGPSPQLGARTHPIETGASCPPSCGNDEFAVCFRRRTVKKRQPPLHRTQIFDFFMGTLLHERCKCLSSQHYPGPSPSYLEHQSSPVCLLDSKMDLLHP